MLEIKQVKQALKSLAQVQEVSVESVVNIAKIVSREVAKKHRYNCGIDTLEISDSKWFYKGIEQPNPKARGFFESPDGQNGEFYYSLKDVGFTHHFYMAEYYWGVKKGNVILTYTEGDLDVFERPIGNYQSPK